MLFKTRTCLHCANSSTLDLNDDDYERWQTGSNLDDAFPEMSYEEKEMLISGTHPDCWDEMFRDEEDSCQD